jgi:hypothetical protein
MNAKMLCLVILVMLQVEHATADSDQPKKLGNAMANFMHAGAAQPPVYSRTANTAMAMTPTEPMVASTLETLAALEKQNSELKAVYQGLRAQIQKLPQADIEASVASPSSFGWLASFIASAGLAASIGVAAVRKYSQHGQQGSESTLGSQISLTPQRSGLIVASAAAEEQTMMSKDNAWDPLNLADGQSSEDKVVEVQHGRLVAGMIGTAGIMMGAPLPAYADESLLASINAVLPGPQALHSASNVLIAANEGDFGGYFFPTAGLGLLAAIIVFLAPPLEE